MYVCMYVYIYVCMYVFVYIYIYIYIYTRIYVLMYDYIYVLFVCRGWLYIDINTLAQGIKSFVASQVWFQAVDGARTYRLQLLVGHANHSAT